MDIKSMMRELISVNNLDWDIPTNESEQIKMLNALRTISRPAKLSDEYYKNEKEYILSNRNESELVNVDDIAEELLENIHIYLGDITLIKTDAIVNAANEKLLGCFVPEHKCIDNAIHMAAGLKLRNACNDIMVEQGRDEEAGTAKITEGYNLPSKYVFHTVGPNKHKLRRQYNGDAQQITEAVMEQLTGCYNTILDMTKDYDIKNVVFCSISTGVYGVPIEFASKIALTTINEYLQNSEHNLDKVIINVFSRKDYNEYKKQAEQIKG